MVSFPSIIFLNVMDEFHDASYARLSSMYASTSFAKSGHLL